jgi:hypothetical protein
MPSIIFILIAIAVLMWTFLNQIRTIYIYIKSLLTESYETILNRKFGEKINIPINEQSFNLIVSFIYLGWNLILLWVIGIQGPLSHPPINLFICGAYFFLALLSSNLFACSMTKRNLEKVSKNISFTGGIDFPPKGILLKKYVSWTLIPMAFYIIAYLK